VKTRDLAYVSLFAALTAVLGLLPTIPIGPVPITAQNLGLLLAGSVLGARRGFLSQLLFLVLVAIGLPLLGGGAGGLPAIVGPYAGYVLMWPVGALLVGLLTERLWRRASWGTALLANVVGGVLAVDIVGAVAFGALEHLPFWHAVVVGLLVFLPGDLVKAAIAATVGDRVRRSYPVIERPREAVPAR
jgi:biotin transport system substrate-specific component